MYKHGAYTTRRPHLRALPALLSRRRVSNFVINYGENVFKYLGIYLCFLPLVLYVARAKFDSSTLHFRNIST